MGYIRSARTIYETLNELDFSAVLSEEKSYFSPLKTLTELSAYKDLRYDYLKVCSQIIYRRLDYSKVGKDIISKVRAYEQLEDTISMQMLFFLFWIWHNGIEFSDEELQNLTTPIFIGIVGYTILDFYSDKREYGKEFLYLSSSLVRIAEEIFSEVFYKVNTRKIFNKHAYKFSEFEFIEKRNLWKNCPLSWQESWKLGYKSAPSFSIYEVLFESAEFDKSKILDLINGMTYLAAAIQIMDDFGDAISDLANGVETLVMKGFYYEYGNQEELSQQNIIEFLNEDRSSIINSNVQKLFLKSGELFERHNDEILMLFNEIQLYRFNNLFESVE